MNNFRPWTINLAMIRFKKIKTYRVILLLLILKSEQFNSHLFLNNENVHSHIVRVAEPSVAGGRLCGVLLGSNWNWIVAERSHIETADTDADRHAGRMVVITYDGGWLMWWWCLWCFQELNNEEIIKGVLLSIREYYKRIERSCEIFKSLISHIIRNNCYLLYNVF